MIDTKHRADAGVNSVIEQLPPEIIADGDTTRDRVLAQISLVLGYESTLRDFENPQKELDHTRLKRHEIANLVEAGLLKRDADYVEFGRFFDYELTSRAELLLDVIDE